MFYPFNSAIAKRHSEKAQETILETTEVLIDAYLSIAHVYIQRACLSGRTRAYIYLPREICKRVVEILQGSGFEVTRNEHNPCYYVLSWGEV